MKWSLLLALTGAFFVSSARAQSPPLTPAAARQRAAEMRRLLERDPAEFVRRAMPAAERDQLPADVREHVERRVAGRGFFGVYCSLPADDAAAPHDHRHEGFEREVILDGVRYRGFVFGKWREVQTRHNVPIAGIALGDAIAIGDTPTPDEQAAAGKEGAGGDDITIQLVPNKAGTNLVLYMIARFRDETSYPITETTATNNLNVVSAHFGNATQGRVGLRGISNATVVADVTFITLPQPLSYGPIYNSNFGELLTHARNAAASNGFNYANYNLDIVVTTNAGFSYAGRAYVGSQGAHLRADYTSLRTAGHELGHNLGLWHAQYWRTDAVLPFGKDTVPGGYVSDGINHERIEYGHYFSLMSAQSGGEMNDATKPHFTGQEKAQLGWLSGSEVQYVNTSGTYRLFRHDHRDTTNTPRAIRIETPSSDYSGSARRYWLNYRYAPWSSAQNFMRNGLQIDVATTSYTSDGSIQLDMTPYSNNSTTYLDQSNLPSGYWTVDNNDKLDGSLLVGRTYSDRAAGIHITPIATGNLGANQEYIDVVINLGTFPTNQPPVIESFTASATQTGANQNVTFNVTASDPDGDALAYSWFFDDLPTFTANGLNTNTAVKSWSAAGQYRVTATVSDRKGGIATASTIVQVGAPTNQRQIWGRVLWAGKPVHNARVAAATFQTWTDADGSYALTDLSAVTNYTVTCMSDGLNFVPQFSNPVSLGAGNAYGRDFYATNALPGGGSGGSGFNITGTVTDGGAGIAGAEVTGGGKVAITDAAGNYTLAGFLNGTYTVTVAYAGWTFTPASRNVTINNANSTGNNFARSAPYQITGRVNGPPAGNQDPAPRVYLSTGASVLCTRAGPTNNRYWSYTLGNVPAGQYSLSAELAGYACTPFNFTNPLNVASNLTDQILTGIVASVAGTISGRVTENGLGILGVTVTAGAAATTTDSDGFYRLSNLAAGSYTVVATKPGYTFNPGSITSVSPPSSGRNFAAVITNTPPVITSLTATPTTVPGVAGTTTLRGTATGNGPLIFDWAATTSPGAVTFSANNSATATNTVVTFQNYGTHTFRLRVTDANHLTATASVSVVVNTEPSAMVVRPYQIYLEAGGTITFTAQAWDTAGNLTPVNPTWTVTGGGTITTAGVFTALSGGGPFAVIATEAGLSATGYVWVTDVTTPVVTVVASDATASEPGANTGAFTIWRTGLTDTSLTVHFSVTGTASNGLDYATITSPVTIPVGSNSVNVIVTPLDDSLIEGPETVTLTILAGSDYDVGSPNSATVTIFSDDLNQPPTVAITSPATGTIFEFPATITVDIAAADTDGTVTNVSLFTGNTLIGSDATAPYSIVWTNPPYGAHALTARASDDFGAVSTSAVVNIVVQGMNFTWTGAVDTNWDTTTANWTGDGLYYREGRNVIFQNVGVTLGHTNVVIPAGGVQPASVYITNTTAKTFTFFGGTIGGTGHLIKAGAGTATFSGYTNSHPFAGNATVRGGVLALAYATNKLDLALGAGTNIVDGGTLRVVMMSVTNNETSRFLNPILVTDNGGTLNLARATGNPQMTWSGPVTFQPGASVNIVVDSGGGTNVRQHELTGPMTLAGTNLLRRVTNAGNTHLGMTGNIGGAGTLVLSNGLASIWRIEGTGNDYDGGTFILDDRAINNFATFANAIEVGTNATLGVGDVTVRGGGFLRLQWPGNLATNATLHLETDALGTNGVVFVNAHVTNQVAGLVLGGVAQPVGLYTATNAVGFIFGPGAIQVGAPVALPVVTVVASGPTASEFGLVAGAFTVQRTGTTVAELVVNYALSGSASNGVDYAALPGAVTLGAGESNGVVTVTPLADAVAEGLETVTLTLAGGAGYEVGAPAQATVFIEDLPMDDWRHSHFTAAELADPAISGDEADPDGDGLTVLLEYGLGLEPKVAEVLPGPRLEGGRLTLTYTRRVEPTDVRYAVEGTDRLGSGWSTNDITEEVLGSNGLIQTNQATDGAGISTHPSRFLRLQVWRP